MLIQGTVRSPTSLAVDSAGNVYVGGRVPTDEPMGGSDSSIFKYDSNGTLLLTFGANSDRYMDLIVTEEDGPYEGRDHPR